jgi:hypothetical protein
MRRLSDASASAGTRSGDAHAGMTPFRPETVEELLAAYPPRVARLAEAARRAVRAAVPEAVERLRPGWLLVGYDAPGYFACVAPQPDRVRIGFEWGILLPDPRGLLEGRRPGPPPGRRDEPRRARPPPGCGARISPRRGIAPRASPCQRHP